MTDEAQRRSQADTVDEPLEQILGHSGHSAQPAIGIDLDGCIDEAPTFFKTLAECWPGAVYVITFRADLEKARRDVERFGIRYSELVLVGSFAQKADEIRARQIVVYFDDQDEILMHVPEWVTVFKIRNGGNYDFDARKWLYSRQTGKSL